MRANQGSVDHCVSPERQSLVVTHQLEPAVEEAESQASMAARHQIHRGEGGVVHDIDPAQRGIELDRVEQAHVVVEQKRIGQVQITVAFAHPAAVLPLVPDARQRCGLLAQPSAQPGDLVRKLRPEQRLDAAQGRLGGTASKPRAAVVRRW